MNKKYFTKEIIDGNFSEKYWQKNEINIFKILSQFNPVLNDKKEGYTVKVPNFYGVFDKKMQFEKVNGKTIITLNNKEKIKIYNSVFKFLSLIDKNIKGALNIKRFYLQFYVFKSSVLSVVCAARNLNRLSLFASLIFHSWKCLPYILFRSRLIFTHKDLHDKNIILTKNKTIYLVDFEVAVLTDSVVDLATFFYYHRNENLFLATFFSQPKLKKYLRSKSNFYAFKLYLIFIGLYNLSIDRGLEHNDILNYLSYTSILTNKLELYNEQ